MAATSTNAGLRGARNLLLLPLAFLLLLAASAAQPVLHASPSATGSPRSVARRALARADSAVSPHRVERRKLFSWDGVTVDQIIAGSLGTTRRHVCPFALPMASAPQVRAELWTPLLPAKPSFPPSAPPPSAPPLSAPPLSAPPPSAQPPPPLPFHLWRRRQQRRVRSAFSAASGARKQWDAASADGLRAATAVVNRLVQLKQLPGKDVGAVGSMEGILARAAEKIRRLMSFLSHTSLFSFSSPCSTSPPPRPPFSSPPRTPTTISCVMLCSG
ncbi:unnamed protein product [Closterium sp. Naga37s-1]|nr:unnamed protein product [Closterium sp. Naga37s-1]